jgi:hypothetical protein
MKRTISLLLLIVTVAIAAYLWREYTRSVPGLENATPDAVITADELFDSFDTDESQAMARFGGKVVEVTGTVIGFETSSSGRTNVFLHAENALANGVNCSFASTVEVTAQEPFTARCNCQGFLMDVILNNCYAVNR